MPVTEGPSSPTTESNSAWRRLNRNTHAPSSTKRRAVASPMPLVPPVITAVFPVSNPMSFPFLEVRSGVSSHACPDGGVHGVHGTGALADGGGHSFHRSRANVAGGEHCGHVGLERQRD